MNGKRDKIAQTPQRLTKQNEKKNTGVGKNGKNARKRQYERRRMINTFCCSVEFDQGKPLLGPAGAKQKVGSVYPERSIELLRVQRGTQPRKKKKTGQKSQWRSLKSWDVQKGDLK